MNQKAYIAQMVKGSNNLFSIGQVAYISKDKTGNATYSCIMPITGLREEFVISSKLYSTYTLPACVAWLVEHINTVSRVMTYARDLRPMNKDLEPLCDEEQRLFDVRRTLRSFPRKTK